eukprot:1155805-Lingulodinium_polyedra.AAC.1
MPRRASQTAASTSRSLSRSAPSAWRMQIRDNPVLRNRCRPEMRNRPGRSLSAPGPRSRRGRRVLRAR